MQIIDKVLTYGDLCVVERSFTGERNYKRGEVVDVTGWRTASKLVEQRYLSRLPSEYCLPPADADGRRMAWEVTGDVHGQTE